MTFPFDIHIGNAFFPIHPLFELMAFSFGYWYYRYLKSKKIVVPLAPAKEWAVIIGMILGAFVGSRLVAGLEDPATFFHHGTFFYYVGSQTVLGGLIGGIIGVELTKKIIGLKRRTGDLFVFPILLAIMIGRVGCFLTGVKDGTVGLPSTLPWALDQGDGILRHPTSAYEIFFLIIIFVILRLLERYWHKKGMLASNRRGFPQEGDMFRLAIIGYGTFRFFVEYIKPIHPLLIGLSSIQIVSALAVIYYSVTILLRVIASHKQHDHSRTGHLYQK